VSAIQRSIAEVNSLPFGSYADVVAVYDNAFQQVFLASRPIKASIKRDVKDMTHPLETGAQVTDHRVINPVEIELSMILPGAEAKQVYQQIVQEFLKSTILIVQTRADVFKDQFIIAMPHEESADAIDAFMLSFKTKQVLFSTTASNSASSSSKTPRNPENTNTRSKGEISGETAKPAETKKASEAYRLLYK
jgi:hypothetical protein